MPDIPKGHKVIDTVKDNKGFYRIIQRPDGTKYSQTLKLFTEQDNDRKVRAENKSLGQYSTTNIKGNMANAMALTAVGGGATALALHNATQGRQDKVGRKVRGAAFGNTRPQGVGLKTPAGTAGDVRGRISTDRPPAIVRSVDSFNKRGSTMPQTGDLFNQPEPPSGGTKKAGTRYAPAGTAKATGKGTRGVPRPSPRSNFKPATGAKPTGGMPAQLSQMPPGGAGPTAPGRTNVAGAINQSKMPAQFKQMPPSGAGPTANVPSRLTQSIPKPGFLNNINKFVSNLGKGRTGIKQVDAMYQAAGMIDKYGGEPYRQHMAAHPEDKKMTPMQLSTHIRESKLEAPKATLAATAPAASGGNKPVGGQKPYEPRYFPEAGGNGNAVRKPDSYLGEAFDYSLQKGTTSGSKYLEHMFRRDKVSEDDQQRLRERFNKKVVGDLTLKEYGADKGITQTLEGKKSGLGEALLGKYRDTGTYKGNTDYDVMRAAAEARMARK